MNMRIIFPLQTHSTATAYGNRNAAVLAPHAWMMWGLGVCPLI